MNADVWSKEREMLESIIADIESGLIWLDGSQAEYVRTLKQRIAHLDGKLATA